MRTHLYGLDAPHETRKMTKTGLHFCNLILGRVRYHSNVLRRQLSKCVLVSFIQHICKRLSFQFQVRGPPPPMNKHNTDLAPVRDTGP